MNRLMAVTSGLVVGAVLAAVFTGEGWGVAIGLLVGYGMGCLVMYTTVANLKHEEAENLERRKRYGR